MIWPARIAIAGGPRVGKTTLGLRLHELLPERRLLHTDDLIDRMSWSEVSDFIVRDLAGDPWIVEGVRVAHALRKGLQADLVIWLDRPWVPLTPGQASMSKAVRTVYEEWRRNRGTTEVISGSEAWERLEPDAGAL